MTPESTGTYIQSMLVYSQKTRNDPWDVLRISEGTPELSHGPL